MWLDDYKGLIEQLIPVYDSEDFEDVFQMMTQETNGPARLQIKMELNRIMAPCHQIVDLRGRVKGECRPYELNGLKHWLDDVAINTYHKRIKVFGGKYRVGLYEALMNTRNNFRILHQQGKLEPKKDPLPQRDTQFDASLIRFGYYLTRGENRLQIATQVDLALPFNQSVHGITSDLSYSGAKFKVPSAFKYSLGQTVTAKFPKMAETFNDPRLNQGTDYRILGIDDNQENDSFKWLRLKTISDNTAIKDAIDRSQQVSQHRTRKNHEDKVIQARTKGYEHCFLKHTTSMPLFFAGDQLKYSLLTEHNRHIWDSWHDERNQPVINHLLSAERMATLGKAGLKQCSTLIYSFCHEHDQKRFFYSAALPEMTLEQRHLFWHIGATKKSWRVTRLTVYPISQDVQEQLQEIAPDMVDQLSSLTHIGVLQDLTNEQAQQDYRLPVKPKLPSKTLQAFRHLRNPVSDAKAIYFDPKPQRSESRFLFQTPIELHHPEFPLVTGSTLDFSISGLNIKLNQPLPAKRGDEVTIKFNDLQKLDKNAPLSQMPYKIVRVSPDRSNIQLTTGSGSNASRGEQFLRRLIQHNETKLTLAEEVLPSGELLLAMHQMLLTRLNGISYFTEKVDHKIKVKAIGCNLPMPPLAKLFNQIAGGRQFSLEPIFRHRVKPMLAETMRPIEIRKPYVHEMYLWVQRKGETITHLESKLSDEFDSIDARIRFIKKAKTQGEFMALRISAVPVLSPMTALTGKELGELARMTLHRARALEVEFNSLIGCGEMFDITDEVLVRLEIG
ncbi:PilZ domain-containing protein [Photobacterium sp. SDRW27]|uniref:PilZ domain-containing protein n=1 Tax=Photobacterium obscurum TaxID=2829490 RepID=UPI0022445FA6|nr:PilZ domain-containing protein [Photobacterium obscurum]MCW8330017.1 PilZ domain-containing protein [Photobacterium obscurum]